MRLMMPSSSTYMHFCRISCIHGARRLLVIYVVLVAYIFGDVYACPVLTNGAIEARMVPTVLEWWQLSKNRIKTSNGEKRI
jgi:hypothetical protein